MSNCRKKKLNAVSRIHALLSMKDCFMITNVYIKLCHKLASRAMSMSSSSSNHC